MKRLIIIVAALASFLATNAQTEKERKWAMMHYMDHNYTESFKEYSHLAQYMDPDDLCSLAQHFHYGYGTERDMNKAIVYYKMAADLGDKLSQAELCEYYFDDEEIDNEQQKKDLYKYSRMFCTNFEYSNSTNSTDDQARFALYLCYKNGWGTLKNPLLADIWLAFAAYNDSMYAQDEFCSIYGLNSDYDSDAEELALAFAYFKHLYEKIPKFIRDDNSVESRFFKINYLIAQQTPTTAIEGFKEIISLYDATKISKEGKAVLYDIISEFAKYDNAIKEKYNADADNYELISEEEKSTWQHIQLTKVVWKADVALNKTNPTTGCSNGHDWVDLGLPSGTRWATCNIGAETPYASGAFYAWGETNSKKRFTRDNYNTNRSLLIMNDINDTARRIYGGNWTVPSCEDWRELLLYCKVHFDVINKALTITSPNNQTLFLPLVQNSENDGVIYWTNTCTSSMFKLEGERAVSLLLESNPDWGFVYVNNWRGCPIRPVCKY